MHMINIFYRYFIIIIKKGLPIINVADQILLKNSH